MQQAINGKVEIHTSIQIGGKKANKDILKEFVYSKYIFETKCPIIYSYSEATTSISEFERKKLFYPEAIIDYINNNDIDILHVNSSTFSHFLKSIKEKTNCKIVVHIREMFPHGIDYPVDNFIIEQTKLYADFIICISDNEAKFFLDFKNVLVFPNPHDFKLTERFLKIKEAKKSLIKIGMCANFNPTKGHLIFLDAAQILNERIAKSSIKLEFVIIGYPIKRRTLKEGFKYLCNYGYKHQFDKKIKINKIKNLRIIPFTFEIYKELADLDIYVRPDLSGNPWGRDIIEAMALKLPIVATGTSEFYIKNNETGFLVTPNNPSIIAEKIIDILESSDLRKKMGTLAYKSIKDKCDLNLYGEKIMNIYNKV